MSDDKLTIAQALRRIKKLKGEIAEHENRIRAGVSYVSDRVPAFRYADERQNLTAAKQKMLVLQSQVAVANATTKVSHEGMEIPLALAVRMLEELKGEVALLKGLTIRNETVKTRESEWSDVVNNSVTVVTETVWVSDLSEQKRAAEVKSLQGRFEELNNIVEDANHKVTV